jgi:GDP-4-dehydro-6-deoxy-D-mannose reductase
LKALITGVSGFVGSHLAEYLLAHTEWEIAGTAQSATRNIDDVRQHIEIYPADLSRMQVVVSVLEQVRPDVIFHLAAMAATARSWDDPGATLRTNVGLQANILQAVVDLDLHPRMIVVGSSEEYGAAISDAATKGPITEDTPFRPTNPYAVSKIAQDMLGLQYFLSHGLDTVRVRPFNHIGPRQNLGFVVPDFASQIARIEAGQQPATIAVGNLDAQRDFTDVRDVVRAYHELALKGKSGEVYNVGSGRACSIQWILDQLIGQSRAPIQVVRDPKRLRPSDTPWVVCDKSKLSACTGWEPQISLEKSLTDTLRDWRERVTSVERGHTRNTI